MKLRINWMFFALLIFVQLLVGCSLSSGPSQMDKTVSASETPRDPEQLIKQKESGLPLSPARELVIIRQVQLPIGREAVVKSPVRVLRSGEKDLLICDNNAHAVHLLPPDSDQVAPLIPKPNETALVWPFSMQVGGKNIYVSDDEGIKVYDSAGTFQRLLRVYYQVNDFAVGTDGSIYINPVFRVFKQSNPLLVKLDQEGKRVMEFGPRLNRADVRGLDDQAYISVSEDLIVAAFRHRPTVQLYSKDGRLIREIIIGHPTFSHLKPLEQDTTFTHPSESKYRLPVYIAGLKVLNDRILILLDLPKPEIVELDLQGEEINRYRGEVTGGITAYKGFEAELVGNQYRISTIVSDNRTFMSFVQFVASRAR